ncbi:hypothetical protein THOB06_10434 [Vibrio rotiferianus]|nr:hypothetical protein THOB06_10434 [Vibrio rotiferianus]
MRFIWSNLILTCHLVLSLKELVNAKKYKDVYAINSTYVGYLYLLEFRI